MKAKSVLSLLLAVLLLSMVCVPAFAAEPTYKNVIIMIGDGMGENHLLLAEEYGHSLFMNKNYDLRGQSKTHSASHITTDSAAGGTALACGLRVINQTVGVSPVDPTGYFTCPVSITEAAARRGMRTGIVTTDKTSGATPADFTAHVIYRKMAEQISAQQVASEFDLVWGAKEDTVSREDAEANGFTFITNKEEMDALQPGSRSFGQFSGEFWRPYTPNGCTAPTLADMSLKAIDLLNKDNPNGFVLMIEGAHIDKRSHTYEGKYEEIKDFDAKRESVVDAVVGFDDAIQAVVKFARKDKHTIVVVTADHETGNLYYDNGRYRFHSSEHTAKNVPVFVYGAKDLFAMGEAVENYTIPIRLAAKLGWSEDVFPAMQPGLLVKKLRRLARVRMIEAAA